MANDLAAEHTVCPPAFDATDLTKRVLLVGNFLSSSRNLHAVCEELASQLDKSNWSVVVTSSKSKRISRLLDMLKTIVSSRRRYDVAQVDVYSGHSFLWAELACRALRVVKKPYVLTLHGGNLPGFAAAHPRRVRRLLRSANRITTPSRFLRDEMSRYRRDIEILPNALPIDAYPFRPRNPPRPRLVWLRAFHKIYNPALAAKVLATLVDEFPSIRLTMIGPDKGDGSLQETQRVAAGLGVADRITFAGPVAKADVPDWISQADIFLNTTNVDNTPVSVVEAMACGLCVVSTNVGGIPFLLSHDDDALLVPPDDAAAMGSAVRRLLTAPELGARLSVNGRGKAAQFDWSIVGPRWERLLQGIQAAST